MLQAPGTLTRRRARPVTLVAATVFALLAVTACDGMRGQGSGLAGVVGHWADSAGATVVNGEQWGGSTTREALEASSRRLFGGVNEAFLANGSAPAAFQFAVYERAREFSSGTLRVQFNLLGGQSDQIAGLLFDLKPTGEYHYVRYNTKDGNLALWRFANGERTVIVHGEVHKQVPLGTWHELVVEVRGRQVHGFIAGDTTISVSHALDAAPAGRIGVWAKRDAVTAFRGFTAQR